MSAPLLHSGLANACTIFSLIIAGYGFWLFFRRQNITSSFWGVLVIGQILYLAQLVVGLSLLIGGAEPPSQRGWIHYLYGAVLVISIPGLYAYTRGRDTRREALLYALIGLFLAGISLRAVTTALSASV